MSLEQTLRNAVYHLRSGRLMNEAQVKQAVILPVLRALDWDDTDPEAFRPEYSVGKGLVDYALLDHGQALVFVEAKRVGNLDAGGEEQLFRYAAHNGVPLLVLTDGNLWNFYLSMAPGVPRSGGFTIWNCYSLKTRFPNIWTLWKNTFGRIASFPGKPDATPNGGTRTTGSARKPLGHPRNLADSSGRPRRDASRPARGSGGKRMRDHAGTRRRGILSEGASSPRHDAAGASSRRTTAARRGASSPRHDAAGAYRTAPRKPRDRRVHHRGRARGNRNRHKDADRDIETIRPQRPRIHGASRPGDHRHEAEAGSEEPRRPLPRQARLGATACQRLGERLVVGRQYKLDRDPEIRCNRVSCRGSGIRLPVETDRAAGAGLMTGIWR